MPINATAASYILPTLYSAHYACLPACLARAPTFRDEATIRIRYSRLFSCLRFRWSNYLCLKIIYIYIIYFSFLLIQVEKKKEYNLFRSWLRYFITKEFSRAKILWTVVSDRDRVRRVILSDLPRIIPGSIVERRSGGLEGFATRDPLTQLSARGISLVVLLLSHLFCFFGFVFELAF